jgi:hypothetical protein
VDHRLLVARLVVGQDVGVLLERLPHAAEVAVAEDAEAAGEEGLAAPVALDVLSGEEADERLGDGEPHGVRASSPANASSSGRVGMSSAQARRAAT